MHRRSSRQRIALAVLLALTITIVTIDFRENPGGPIRRLQSAALAVVAPLQDGVASIFRPVGDFLSSLGQIGSLKRRNAELETEIEKLQAQQRRIPEIVRERDDLLKLLKDKDWTAGRTLGARVIGVGPSNQEWTALLDRGEAYGVSADMAVVSAEGLVGRVVLTSAHESQILMIIDPRHTVGARLTGSGQTGALTGRGGGDLRFDLIDPGTQINAGETVVTSGYDRGIYPAGIPIGRVTRLDRTRDILTEVAFVRPFVDFRRLGIVQILLDSRRVSVPTRSP